jgi:hypothetical protein
MVKNGKVILTSTRVFLVSYGTSKSATLNLVNLIPYSLKLWTIVPDIRPIAISDARSDTSTNSVEHELGRVNVGRALCAMSREVAAQDVCVCTDVAEVNCVSAALEKEKTIETFKEKRRGLMDRTQDRCDNRTSVR